MKNNTEVNYTPYQLRLPIEISKIIDVDDPVLSFREVMDHIDLSKYFADRKVSRTGRPRCDSEKLLMVVLFAFMDEGFESLRGLAKRCRNDIRYMWLLDGMEAPSFMTFSNFIRHELNTSIEDIFKDINEYIFTKEGVDTEHVYIDGTKIEANANKYSWVWKKSCLTNRDKVFGYITELLRQINEEVLFYYDLKMEPREEYAIEYVEHLMKRFLEIVGKSEADFVKGQGHKKSIEQKQYEKLKEYLNRLKKYAEQIEICGESRNSYAKADHGATFMRIKRDYMGNDQLLPAYNMQLGVCDEYVAVVRVEQYASDMDCFVPLMEEFHSLYGKYPQYPVADAGYGSFNNYLYCEEHGMEKFMKFTTFEKERKDKEYREDPFRAVNFVQNEDGQLVCPGGKTFSHLRDEAVRGNKYGRTEELYVCENCAGCTLREKCFKGKGNRVVRLNRELTSIHEEVMENLECTHGMLLMMNRCIQSEGTFGSIKWNRWYKRALRRGIDSVKLEFMLIACGFNLYKYHNKKLKALKGAA